MKKDPNNRSFWNRYAKIYDIEVGRFSRAAYQEMYRMISNILTKEMQVPGNVHFSVEDAADLSFADQTFDAVIISNALHIMPDPERVLENIRRVLKPEGILIDPTFSHGHIKTSTWNLNAAILRLLGFETYSKWKPEEYLEFINQNGFCVQQWKVLKAAFPLVYLEAKMK